MNDIIGDAIIKFPNIKDIIKKEVDDANPLPTFDKTLREQGFEKIEDNDSSKVYALDTVKLKEVRISGSLEIIEYNGFEFYVYVAPNAASLAKLHLSLGEPRHDQIMIFLEAKDSYNKLGTFFQVKVGSDIYSKKNLPFRDILIKASKAKKLEIDAESAERLLNLAVYKQGKKGFIIFTIIHAIFKAKDELEKVVFTKVGEFFGVKVTGWLDELRIDESRWNPDHKDYPSQAILPQRKIDDLTKGSENSEQKQEKIRDFVLSHINSNLGEVIGKGDGIIQELKLYSIFSKSIAQKVENQWKSLSLSITNQKNKLIEKLDGFLSIMDTLPDLVMAYICGIVNAIVDTIAGFFELLGMICMARAYVIDANANKEVYTSWIVETLENLLEMYDRMNFDQYLDLFFEKKDQLIRQIIVAAKKASLSKINRNHFIQAAYFCGYIVGLVVSFLLECFLTGGTAAVKEAIELIGKGASRITRGIKDVGKHTVKLFDNIHGLLNRAFNAIKSDGKKFFEKFEQWLDELIEAIKKFFKFGVDVLKKKIDDLNPSELDWMASRNFGNLGGRLLTAGQIRKLRGTLKNKGFQLIVEGDIKAVTKLFKPMGGFKSFDELILHMQSFRPPKVGLFHAETKQFILISECTEIVAFHELAHLKHFESIGEVAYKTLSKLDKETYVWKQILGNRNKWTKAELDDALNYINRERAKAGLKLTKL